MTPLTILGALAALLGTAGIGGMLKTLLDHQRGKRKQSDDVAMELVKLLETRVKALESALEIERDRCDAELQVHRHRINNQRTIIYSLLHLFDVPATRRKEMLEGIRQNLAAMEQAEAVEKAIVATAPLKAEAAE